MAAGSRHAPYPVGVLLPMSCLPNSAIFLSLVLTHFGVYAHRFLGNTYLIINIL